MGNSDSALISDKQLEVYQLETFFTRKEILRIYQSFEDLNPDKVREAFLAGNYQVKMDYGEVTQLSELKFSPFKDRICRVFSEDQSGDMTFSDFLDMLSVMSMQAPKDLKAAYAFKIYDFNDDGEIDRTDLDELVNRVTGFRMKTEDVDGIVDEILKECDMDENGTLTSAEFEDILQKAPEFSANFNIEV